MLGELPWFVWWKVHLGQTPKGDPSERHVRKGHILCHFLSYDISLQFHAEIGYRAAEPEMKHRIGATKEQQVCTDFETCLIPFQIYTFGLNSMLWTVTLTIGMKIYLLFASNSMPHNSIASLLIFRVRETVSTVSLLTFSTPLLFFQAWFYFPIHPRHSFFKLKTPDLFSLTSHRAAVQPDKFVGIAHSGIFANGGEKRKRKVQGRYRLRKMRVIFLTHVPMTTPSWL